MIRLVHTITIAILLLFAGSLSAQSIIKKAQVTPNASYPRAPIATSDIEELNNAKEQIKILDAQLQATKSYQSSFLDTVHWALSVVLALVVFLIGYGWITNFKMHERDKELLKGELEAYVRSKAIELDDMFKTKLEDANTKSEERLKGALVIVNGRAIDLNNRVFKLEFDQSYMALNSETDPGIALSKALGLLERCSKESLGHVTEILNFILKKFDQGGKLGPHESVCLNIVLDSLPEHYNVLIEKIRKKNIDSEIFQI